MEQYMKEIQEATNFLNSKIGETPAIAMILGSGLGMLGEHIENKIEIAYAEIPGFAVSTVVGHAGKLVVGELSGKRVLAMMGRFHLYEGHEVHRVVLPVRVFKMLGIQNIIVTNAAGGVNRALNPGDLMLITDHIGFFAPNPLKGENLEQFGPRFPDMSAAYGKDIIALAEKAADKAGISVKKGVYAYAPGPSYESPAEIRMLDRLGVDAVGMSTVPEVIAARHAGMNILGISCITNMASGILPQPLSHEEVTQTAQRVGTNFCNLLKTIVSHW